MKTQHRDFSHLRVVPLVERQQLDRGNALVFGPFPPLTSPSSDHACATLHILKSLGYRIVSATGPGLAMAGHQLNFTSKGRFETSTTFLGTQGDLNLAVFYGRSAEFVRICKPSWHRRRLEELRRIRFLMRVIDRAEKTCLVLEHNPLKSRDSLCFWAVGRAWSALRGKPFCTIRKAEPSNAAVRRLTGLTAPLPARYQAEASAYEAAFEALGPDGKVRLTCTRSQQCAQSFAARAETEQTRAIVADLAELVSVFRRQDLRALPQFRLLLQSPPTDANGADRPGRALETANAPDPAAAKLGLPITRYMTHLRAVMGKQKDYPLNTRADGRKFLNWALWEAPSGTPGQRLPLTAEICRFLVAASRDYGPLVLPERSDVTPTLGRDSAPFPLSSDLARLWLQDKGLSGRYDINTPVGRIGFAVEVLLRLPDGADPHKVLGTAACTWLVRPIGGTGMCLSRIEYLMALFARYELEGAAAAERPWEDDSIRHWIRNAAADLFPALGAIMPPPQRRVAACHHLTVTGLPMSQTGVGSNLHMSVDAFRRLGLAPVVRNAADQMRRVQIGRVPGSGRGLKRAVNLHHLNADMVPQAMVSAAIARNNAYNIGYLLWEFDVLPEIHQLALDMLDEIWVPTSFLRDTYAAATRKPVHNVLKGIEVPRVSPVDLADYGLEGQAFTFLTCFDFHSSVARKNPLAAVRAFQDAFPASTNADVRLIVKTTPLHQRHWGDPERQMSQIEAAIAADPRVTLIAEHLPFSRLLGLISACDCVLSPHRAEGFGLIPAYGLALKRPVIATDYSGTTDFCTGETATLLPYELVDVAPNQVLHPMKGARWADVDHDAFVAALRDVYENPASAQRKAMAGARVLADRYAPDRQAKRYAARLKEVGAIM